jgi:autoinducer 2 (AI-2) kinase
VTGAGFLLGLDAGGSGVRALLVDAADGRTFGAARRVRPRPAPGTGGLGSELDLEALWSALAGSVREALARAGARPDQVLAVAATSMRFATVIVDRAGEAIFAVPNRDTRAIAEAAALTQRAGAALHARTGHRASAIQALPRLLWLAKHEPALLARAHRVLALGDWLALRLAGEAASEPSQAGESLLFDLSARRWDRTELERAGLLHAEWLPPVLEPGTRLGGVLAPAARELGLREGTPVAVGGADTQCGLLAAGAAAPGALGAVTGTTAPLQLVLDRPSLDSEGTLWTGHFLVSGRWVLESNAGPMGEALEWLAALLAPDHPQPVARLLAEAARSQPGAAGVLSSFGANPTTPRELELPIGSLTLSHLAAPDGPAAHRHLARAVAEGMACAVRAHRERLAGFAPGPSAGALHLAGGMVRSPFWAQLVADVTGAPVAVAASPDTSACGAALCAGVAADVFPDLDAAARDAAARTRTLEPDPERAAQYEEIYAGWQRLCEARAASDPVARGIALPHVLRAMAAAPAPGSVRARPRILATAELDDAALAALRALGEVEHASFRQRMRLLTGPSLVEALRGFAVFVTEVDVVDATTLAELPELRVVASCRGDAVNVDVAACTAHGIPVLNAPGRNAEGVADLTLAFLLMLARKLPAAARFLREPGGEAGDLARMGRAFAALQGGELGAKTVGLVGFGAVGRAVARRLAAFGARVCAHDPFVAPEEMLLAGVEPLGFDELLARSDFVSLHCTVSDETRGLLGAAELARTKPGAYLVNTARAALVDEAALADALARGQLAGAALDVFAVEPPGVDHPLLALENVIATPHVGGNTAEVAGRQGRIVAADLERLLRGERPLFVLDPAALEGFDWRAPRRRPDPAVLAGLTQRPAPAVSDLQREPGAAPAHPPPEARASASAGTPRTSTSSAAAPASAAPSTSAPPAGVRAQMERILRGFAQRIAADPELRAFAPGREVTLHFRVRDLDLELHFGFRAGASFADLGPPAAPAEVQLRLAADVLDGMFTGRVNAMQAAMDGRLSFTGDAAKAMTLQHIQGALARCWRAARDEVGDPGDLTRLGAPAPRAPEPDDALRVELVRVVNELYAQQLITATGGNVSARIPGTDALWITPSQLFKGDLRPEILVRIDLDGRPLDPDSRSPSSESLMHCAILRAKPEAGAVVHAHAPHATILANAGLPFAPISTEAAFFGDIPRVPFLMPGTRELADAVAHAMGSGWAVLMQNHGLLVAGRSLRRAADMVEIIERSAEIILGCHAVGREPPRLPDAVVAELRRMGDLVA